MTLKKRPEGVGVGAYPRKQWKAWARDSEAVGSDLEAVSRPVHAMAAGMPMSI
jgi:hypothetical protein